MVSGGGGCVDLVGAVVVRGVWVWVRVFSPLLGARPLAWLSVLTLLTSVLRAGMLIVCAIRVLDVTTRC